MKFIFKLNDSIKWFYIIGFLILFVSGLNDILNSRGMFYIAPIIILLLFLIYSIVRFNHYRVFYSYSKSIKYLLLDNVPLFVGIIYLVLMDMFYFNQNHEVNFIFIATLMPFIIPTGIGNNRLSKSSNKNE